MECLYTEIYPDCGIFAHIHEIKKIIPFVFRKKKKLVFMHFFFPFFHFLFDYRHA